VIDVGVAGDQDDVATNPSELIHLGASWAGRARHAEPFWPELPAREQGSGHELGEIG
jgi:hypothetical protein